MVNCQQGVWCCWLRVERYTAGHSRGSAHSVWMLQGRDSSVLPPRAVPRPAVCAAGSTDKYWDLFSMSYNVGQPLASIFTPAAQAKYSRLSKLLWRLRRAERGLNDAWRTLKVGGCEGKGRGTHAHTNHTFPLTLRPIPFFKAEVMPCHLPYTPTPTQSKYARVTHLHHRSFTIPATPLFLAACPRRDRRLRLSAHCPSSRETPVRPSWTTCCAPACACTRRWPTSPPTCSPTSTWRWWSVSTRHRHKPARPAAGCVLARLSDVCARMALHAPPLA